MSRLEDELNRLNRNYEEVHGIDHNSGFGFSVIAILLILIVGCFLFKDDLRLAADFLKYLK